ncbi:MAG: IMP cyclohydrolase [Eubacterium ventriosum]
MQMLSLENELKENSYPGRGIVIGKTPNGKHAVTAYFIMGRSENSRNRVLLKKEKESAQKLLIHQSLLIQVLLSTHRFVFLETRLS